MVCVCMCNATVVCVSVYVCDLECIAITGGCSARLYACIAIKEYNVSVCAFCFSYCCGSSPCIFGSPARESKTPLQLPEDRKRQVRFRTSADFGFVKKYSTHCEITNMILLLRFGPLKINKGTLVLSSQALCLQVC